MSRLVNINFNGTSYFGYPTLNGIGDTNGFRSGLASFTSGTWPPGSSQLADIHAMTTLTLTGNSNRVVSAYQVTEGNLLSVTNPNWTLWPSGSNTIGANLSAWSMRCILTVPPTDAVPFTANACIFTFFQTGISQFGFQSYVGGGWGIQGVVNDFGNTLNGTYRMEIQADNAATPKVIARLYANDSTTLTAVISGNPASVAMNEIRGADVNGTQGGCTWRYSEIELWDTRDADGAWSGTWATTGTTGFGSPTYTGVNRKTASYSIPANYTTPSSSPANVYGTKNVLNQGYGNVGRVLDIFLPNNAEPNNADGFPLIVWAHSGFFASGSKNDIPQAFIRRCNNAGYAVASVGYTKSTLTQSSYAAYGTSNADSVGNGYGRYPSHIVDFKLATVRLRDKYSSTGTAPVLNNAGFGFSPTKIIAAGYSAGGYIAIAADVSRGLTSDAHPTTPKNLTISGADSGAYRTDELSVAYTGTDPLYIGSIGFAAPENLLTALNWDWSHNQTNVPNLWPAGYPSSTSLNPGNAGKVHMAARAYNGQLALSANPSNDTLNASSLTRFIAQNLAHVGANSNIAYVRGTADLLVHSQHETDLAASASVNALNYTVFTSPANHDNAMLVYDWDVDINPWLDSAVTLAGGTAGATSASGGASIPSIPSIPTIPSY